MDKLYKKALIDLISMGEKDQAILKKYTKMNSEIRSLQRENTEKLKSIIDKIGYPSISKVGSRASMFAWLITQHSDHDLKFQEYVLNILKELPQNDRSNSEIAYLEDRVLIAKKMDQIYGTQFSKKISDIENVNIRRKRMGLSSLEDYLKDDKN